MLYLNGNHDFPPLDYETANECLSTLHTTTLFINFNKTCMFMGCLLLTVVLLDVPHLTAIKAKAHLEIPPPSQGVLARGELCYKYRRALRYAC